MSCYKWLSGLFGLLLLTSICYAEQKTEEVIKYNVSQSDYTFSTDFNLSTDNKFMGKVCKSSFHLTTHYDCYDRFGLYEGQGVCRLLCLGSLFSWGTEIDVYDVVGNQIGFIDGQAVTGEQAKFSLYDKEGNRIGIAYLDQNCMGFTIVDPYNSNFVLARLTRNFILDTIDNWDIMIYHPQLISPRLVKIFAAFACDSQENFKIDQ